ncbi:MAG: transglycosylase SLT domain-containing protein [Roseiarcus sp.]
MKSILCALALISLSLAGCATPPDSQAPKAAGEPPVLTGVSERVAYYARVYDVPESLIHRVVLRESGYNPAAHHGPFWGLMQLRLDTARGMGYRGPARGLLDADTNLKYAVAYLSNAWLVAGGDPQRALALYASGYFYEARRKGLLDRLRTAEPD